MFPMLALREASHKGLNESAAGQDVTPITAAPVRPAVTLTNDATLTVRNHGVAETPGEKAIGRKSNGLRAVAAAGASAGERVLGVVPQPPCQARLHLNSPGWTAPTAITRTPMIT